MTDKELNKLRDRLAESAAVLCALSKNNPTIARINFQDGFDAAIKALKDNYVEKSKVDKLVEALKFYENEINIEPFYSEVKINGTNNTRPQLNMKYFYVARQAIAEFEAENAKE